MAPIFTGLQTITDTKAGDHQTILSTNTPLSAPENDMTDSLYDQVLGSSGADTTSLAWLLPTVIGAVVAMIILGLLLFYGINALELKMLRWCRRNCSCCSCCCGESEERSALTAGYEDRETEMKRYNYKSSSATSPD